MAVLVKLETVDGIIFAFLEDTEDSERKLFLTSLPESLREMPKIYEKWQEFVKEMTVVILAEGNGVTEDEVRGKFSTVAAKLH